MEVLFCKNCKKEIISAAKFCGSCGLKVNFKKAAQQEKSLQLVIAFYISYLVYAFVPYVLYDDDMSLATEIVVEIIFILLTIGFTFFDFKNILSLYTFKYFTWKNLLFAVVFPIVTGFTVYYSLDWLTMLLYEETDNIFFEYMFYENSFFWAFVFYVIIPPIFEELAFRGFLFNQMLHITNWKVTVLATGFVFALVHFSPLSILWIFPFGIVLGYLRHKYKTLWLGMIVHFIHNLIVVLLDYYYFNVVDDSLFF